ncbi:MAG: hypothetical protein PHD67_01380 [Oscillospiraceae bacterium]|nr:hypothetical protein [Oscillospiraceae bacterium]
MEAMYRDELNGKYEEYWREEPEAEDGGETSEESGGEEDAPEEAVTEPAAGDDTEGEGREKDAGTIGSGPDWQRLREQENRLLADPDSGGVYEELRGEVMQVLEHCRKKGHPEVDLYAAFQAVAGRNLGKILAGAREQARRAAVDKIQANERATPGPLGGATGSPAPGFEHMSDAEFDRYLEMAYRGELRGGLL